MEHNENYCLDPDHPFSGDTSLAMFSWPSQKSGKSSELGQDSGDFECTDWKEEIRSIANANWEGKKVVQHAWTDSEQHIAAALLGLNQMVSAQPKPTRLNNSIHLPQQIPDLSTTVWPAEGGRPAICHPNGANGSQSTSDNSRLRTRPIDQKTERAESSHIAEGLPTALPPDGQEEAPGRRRKRTRYGWRLLLS